MPKPTTGSIPPALAACLASVLALAAPAARASFLEGEALDQMANVVSWFAITVVPIGVIWIFWLVHVLPEKIAEKKGHPNAPAIKVLCLLSLVFGGLLWPLAWLWAYTKPSMYKLAYGTDRVDYHGEQAEAAPEPEPDPEGADAGRTA
jgi:drug/metabolite transporter (DMT)-like permease